ncbi:ABC transporter permease [Streptobacillus moniliformis]|uniref:ABC transporter permease n=1 Tax=Streptobacillus moniliformis TaxID=34105 RepID=UPI0007E3D4B0|nr:ABC transporter permease [Streptobacillus moniliformis]QXW66276.1 ABC transporter permease [Streptobacillus moniliformis]
MYNIFLGEIKRYFLEIKTYYPDYIVSLIISLILYLILFGFETENTKYIGYIYWILASSVLSEASASISSEKQAGTIKNLIVKPYSILTIMTFRTLSWLIINFSKIVLILLILKYVFQLNLMFNILLIPILIITLISIYGFSLILMTLTIVYTKTASFESVISYILLFLSGSVYSVEKMPLIIQYITNYFHLTLGIKISNHILSGELVNLNEILILIIDSIIYLLLGYILFKKIIKNNEKYNQRY